MTEGSRSRLELPFHTVDYLVSLGLSQPGREICGFVLDNGSVHPILNVSPKPEHNFEMDPSEQLRSMKAFSGQISGVYHSHQDGSWWPSEADKRGWPPSGWQYWIICGEKVVEWKREGDDCTVVKEYAATELVRAVPQDPDLSRPAYS